MTLESITIGLAAKWLPKLTTELRRVQKTRSADLGAIAITFSDPLALARYYVAPHGQNVDPAEEPTRDFALAAKEPIFKTIERFLHECNEIVVRDGRQHLIILADAGMGKTSLLMMLKLQQLVSFWPKEYRCELIKLGLTTLDKVHNIPDPSRTVLLLDSLDEDPAAWGRIDVRVSELLRETKNFFATIITCRTQFFPRGDGAPEKVGRLVLAGFSVPSLYLSPFDDDDIDTYLRKRFPRDFWRWLQQKSHPKYHAAKLILQRLDTLRMRPMLLAYIDDLLGVEDGDGGHVLTAYEAYREMVVRWLDREVQIRPDLQRSGLWSACVSVALRMAQKQASRLSESEMAELAVQEESVQAIGLLDLSGRALLNKTADSALRFAHSSIAEFLIADHIIRRRRENIPDAVVDEKITVRGTALLARFMREGASVAARTFIPARDLLSGSTGFPPTCVISDVDFTTAVFEAANFDSLKFVRCGFVDARLSGSSFRRTTIVDCSFRGADLRNCDLKSWIVEDADFSGAAITPTWKQ